MQLASYSNTNIKSVIVNEANSDSKSSYSYVTYMNENNLLESGFIIKIDMTGINEYKIEYFTESLESIGEIYTKNGLVTSSYSVGVDINARKNGFWSDWGDCVGEVIDHWTDGDPFHAAAGLGCIAIGSGCAAIVGIGCAISAY